MVDEAAPKVTYFKLLGLYYNCNSYQIRSKRDNKAAGNAMFSAMDFLDYNDHRQDWQQPKLKLGHSKWSSYQPEKK